MNPEPKIHVRGISKSFRRYASPRDRLVEWLSLGRVNRHSLHTALHPLDFDLMAGESLGIIGENGAGKSTLLKLVSGVLYPNSGSVTTTGRVVSLLELGAGFQPELDGIRNIFESARLLGCSQAEIEARLDRILAFAELGDFVHQPVRTLSSGMYVRLAFSLFAHLDPEVYIVDEALAVGDVFFQQKCFAFLESLKERGVAVIFASHDMPAILRLCDRVLYLEHGRAVMISDPVTAVNRYHASHDAARNAGSKPAPEASAEPKQVGRLVVPADAHIGIANHSPRHGDREVDILGVRFVTLDGAACSHVESNQTARLEVYAVARENIHELSFGMQIKDRLSTVIFEQTTQQANGKPLTAEPGETFLVDFELEFSLAEGQYTVEVYATDCQPDSTARTFDRLPQVRMLTIDATSHRSYHGLIGLRTRYRVRRHDASGPA